MKTKNRPWEKDHPVHEHLVIQGEREMENPNGRVYGKSKVHGIMVTGHGIFFERL